MRHHGSERHGKTPLDLVKLEAKNPINEEADLLAKLGA